MSMILDALRRADQERRKTPAPIAEPALFTPTPAASKKVVHRWPFVLIGALTLGALLLSGLLLFRDKPATTHVQPESLQQAPAESVAEQNDVVAEPAVTTPERERQPPVVSQLYRREASASKPPDESVRSLYRQPEKQALPEPQSQPDVQPQTTATTPENSAPDVLSIRDLSWRLQQSIPSLNYQAHNFRDDDSSTVVINQRERRVGDEVAPDLRIERIEIDGVILQYQGERFKLQALNSWINM